MLVQRWSWVEYYSSHAKRDCTVRFRDLTMHECAKGLFRMSCVDVETMSPQIKMSSLRVGGLWNVGFYFNIYMVDGPEGISILQSWELWSGLNFNILDSVVISIVTEWNLNNSSGKHFDIYIRRFLVGRFVIDSVCPFVHRSTISYIFLHRCRSSKQGFRTMLDLC
jgi:hypothetical protein